MDRSASDERRPPDAARPPSHVVRASVDEWGRPVERLFVEMELRMPPPRPFRPTPGVRIAGWLAPLGAAVLVTAIVLFDRTQPATILLLMVGIGLTVVPMIVGAVWWLFGWPMLRVLREGTVTEAILVAKDERTAPAAEAVGLASTALSTPVDVHYHKIAFRALHPDGMWRPGVSRVHNMQSGWARPGLRVTALVDPADPERVHLYPAIRGWGRAVQRR